MRTAAVVVLMFGVTMAAAAQDIMPRTAPGMPRTLELKNQQGEVVGTATTSGVHTYYRNAKRELIASSHLDPNLGITVYDPNGNVVATITQDGNTLVTKDASGQVVSTTKTESDPLGRILSDMGIKR